MNAEISCCLGGEVLVLKEDGGHLEGELDAALWTGALGCPYQLSLLGKMLLFPLETSLTCCSYEKLTLAIL